MKKDVRDLATLPFPPKTRGTDGNEPTNLLKDLVVAYILGVSPGTLRSWRRRNTGPRFVKYGRSKGSAVRYHRCDIEAFIAECRRLTSSVREA